MSEFTPGDPRTSSAGRLPIDDVPGLADLILFLDKIGLSDDQVTEAHKLLADIHGMAPENSMSEAAGMDAARRSRIANPKPKALTDRDRLEARFPGAAKIGGGRR